jgi:hypothetical protein
MRELVAANKAFISGRLLRVTNGETAEIEDIDLSVSAVADNFLEAKNSDTLNTAVGKLVGVFLSSCPRLSDEQNLFATDSIERQMRDMVIGATDRSAMISIYRMIVELPYFLYADKNWTLKHLIDPLRADNSTSLALWRAIALKTHYEKVLKIIGDLMAERAVDRRLDRQTRRSLSFSLVIETLHSFREAREPSVPYPRIQQMLRLLEDEVRIHAANTIKRFVKDLSKKLDPNIPHGAILFRCAAAPFLRRVWPQERSFVTPGVSREFSNLPACSGEAFAEAVDAIERFLIPFDCWSMSTYGFGGSLAKAEQLLIINDEVKARAFLRLLDLTVGTSEASVVPRDLTDGLDQIRAVLPALVNDSTFRRLLTTSHR